MIREQQQQRTERTKEINRLKVESEGILQDIRRMEQAVAIEDQFLNRKDIGLLDKTLARGYQQKLVKHKRNLENRLSRRQQIIKGKGLSLDVTPDDELSDGGYSSLKEFKNKETLPHRYKIKRSRFRENYPSLFDYPNEIPKHHTVDKLAADEQEELNKRIVKEQQVQEQGNNKEVNEPNRDTPHIVELPETNQVDELDQVPLPVQDQIEPPVQKPPSLIQQRPEIYPTRIKGPNPLLEPSYNPNVMAKQLPKYEGLLNPQPIEIQLKGRLPSYDVDKAIQKYPFSMDIPSIEELKEKKRKLFRKIPEDTIFRRHIPKQVELDKFIDALKEKVIHDYNIPVSVKALRTEYKRSPYFRDIVKYIRNGYCSYV